MLRQARRLLEYRDLLVSWTSREVRVRYKQSAIGGLWAILQPLALMIIFTLVFSRLARVPSDGIPYPLFSYSALLFWTFFASSLNFAVPSLVNNMNLVTKIYFPREILPIGSVGAALLDLCVAAIIFAGLLLFYRVPLSITILWLPLLILVQILLTLGVVFFLAAVNVFFRDVRFVLPLLIQVWMYASPVIYPTTLIPEHLRPFYMLNPMAGLIDSYRRVILMGQAPVPSYAGVSAAVALALFVGGYAFFKRCEPSFADMI